MTHRKRSGYELSLPLLAPAISIIADLSLLLLNKVALVPKMDESDDEFADDLSVRILNTPARSVNVGASSCPKHVR